MGLAEELDRIDKINGIIMTQRGRHLTPDMAAYVIVDIEITDPSGYEEYKKLAGTTVTQYGGEYVVRGGQCETLEGDWQPQRIVVLKFPDSARAKAWLHSAEYAAPRKRRHATANTRMIVVEGV